jgi:hypothetical protein
MKIKKAFIGIMCFSLAIMLGSTFAYASPSDGTVLGATKVIDNGPDSARMNLVLIAEGYTAEEQDDFNADVEAFINYLYTKKPFSVNCSAINIHRINVESTDSGADDPGPDDPGPDDAEGCAGGSGAQVDTYFDASFCYGNIRRLMVASNSIGIDVLNAWVPTWDEGIILVNTPIYGGAGGALATTAASGNWLSVSVHEFGHAGFGLADEYDYWAGCAQEIGERQNHAQVEPTQANITIETTREDVKWNDLILPTTDLPTTGNDDCDYCPTAANPSPGEMVVGLYEGAHYYHCDIFRPTYSCFMRDISTFCPVCERRILQVLEPFMPLNSAPICDANGPYTAVCTGPPVSVTLDGTGSSDPDCNELTYSWTGSFSGGTASEALPNVDFPGAGAFTVDLTVSDGSDSSSCSSTVDISSNALEIDCPADVTVECDQSTDPADTGTATADNVCISEDPSVAVTASSIVLGSCPQEHIITRTWTATDSYETESCSQTISVVDTTPPSISIPANVTVECDQSTDPSNTGIATATDNCDGSPVITFTDSEAAGACPEEKTITRTWTATDACGNSRSDIQTIEVVDTTAPVIDCASPAKITPPDTPISFTSTAQDNCDEGPTVSITEYDCYYNTKKGKKIDKTLSCIVEVNGDTITILDSGGVGSNIIWTVHAVDNCGNEMEKQCLIEVVRPKK